MPGEAALIRPLTRTLARAREVSVSGFTFLAFLGTVAFVLVSQRDSASSGNLSRQELLQTSKEEIKYRVNHAQFRQSNIRSKLGFRRDVQQVGSALIKDLEDAERPSKSSAERFLPLKMGLSEHMRHISPAVSMLEDQDNSTSNETSCEDQITAPGDTCDENGIFHSAEENLLRNTAIEHGKWYQSEALASSIQAAGYSETAQSSAALAAEKAEAAEKASKDAEGKYATISARTSQDPAEQQLNKTAAIQSMVAKIASAKAAYAKKEAKLAAAVAAQQSIAAEVASQIADLAMNTSNYEISVHDVLLQANTVKNEAAKAAQAAHLGQDAASKAELMAEIAGTAADSALSASTATGAFLQVQVVQEVKHLAPSLVAWMKSREGSEWLDSCAGWNWIESNEGRGWLDTYDGANWLEGPHGIRFLQAKEDGTVTNNCHHLTTRPIGANPPRSSTFIGEWLKSPEGFHWLDSESGSRWLSTTDGRSWLQGIDGSRWLQSAHGARWVHSEDGKSTSVLPSPSAPIPTASIIPDTKAFPQEQIVAPHRDSEWVVSTRGKAEKAPLVYNGIVVNDIPAVHSIHTVRNIPIVHERPSYRVIDDNASPAWDERFAPVKEIPAVPLIADDPNERREERDRLRDSRDRYDVERRDERERSRDLRDRLGGQEREEMRNRQEREELRDGQDRRASAERLLREEEMARQAGEAFSYRQEREGAMNREMREEALDREEKQRDRELEEHEDNSNERERGDTRDRQEHQDTRDKQEREESRSLQEREEHSERQEREENRDKQEREEERDRREREDRQQRQDRIDQQAAEVNIVSDYFHNFPYPDECLQEKEEHWEERREKEREDSEREEKQEERRERREDMQERIMEERELENQQSNGLGKEMTNAIAKAIEAKAVEAIEGRVPVTPTVPSPIPTQTKITPEGLDSAALAKALRAFLVRKSQPKNEGADKELVKAIVATIGKGTLIDGTPNKITVAEPETDGVEKKLSEAVVDSQSAISSAVAKVLQQIRDANSAYDHVNFSVDQLHHAMEKIDEFIAKVGPHKDEVEVKPEPEPEPKPLEKSVEEPAQVAEAASPEQDAKPEPPSSTMSDADEEFQRMLADTEKVLNELHDRLHDTENAEPTPSASSSTP